MYQLTNHLKAQGLGPGILTAKYQYHSVVVTYHYLYQVVTCVQHDIQCSTNSSHVNTYLSQSSQA